MPNWRATDARWFVRSIWYHPELRAWVLSAKTINCQSPRPGNLSHTGKSALLLVSDPPVRQSILYLSSDTCGRLHTSAPPLNAGAKPAHKRKPSDIHHWHILPLVGDSDDWVYSATLVHTLQGVSFQHIACNRTMRHWSWPPAASYGGRRPKSWDTFLHQNLTQNLILMHFCAQICDMNVIGVHLMDCFGRNLRCNSIILVLQNIFFQLTEPYQRSYLLHFLQLKASFRFMSQILKQLEFHQISARLTKNKFDRSLMNFTKIKLGVSTTDVESRSREARLIWTPYARQWLIRSGLANEWPAYGRARNPWWLLAKAARSVHLDNHLNFGGVRKNPPTIGSMSLHNFSAVLETPDCEIMILI